MPVRYEIAEIGEIFDKETLPTITAKDYKLALQHYGARVHKNFAEGKLKREESNAGQ